MGRVIEGDLQGQGVKVSLVVSRFNSFITDRLLEGALDALRRHGVEEKGVTGIRGPGSFGVPTTDTGEQAIDRAGTKAGNKGAEAAQSALEMVSLLRRM